MFKSIAPLVEDQSLVSGTHVMWLTTNCNSSFRDPDPSSGLHEHLHTCRHINTDTYINNKINLEKYYLSGSILLVVALKDLFIIV